MMQDDEGNQHSSGDKVCTTSEAINDPDEKEFRLRRDIGLAGSVAVIAGIMVGSGIFVSPTGVLAGSNNSVGLSLVVWAGCGVIALVGALCFCELGSCFSISGGDYTYLHAGFGPLVAFAYVWCSCLISRGTAFAALAVTFGDYTVESFYPGHCKPPKFFSKTLAASLLLLLTLINCVSLKFASKLQEILTLTKFVAMAVIIVGGIVRLCQGDPIGMNNLSNAFRTEDLAGIGFSEVGLAFYQGLWAYDGWNELNMVSEEVKNSHTTIPRAIIIAVPLVTLFYLLVNISYFAVLTPEEVLQSSAVAVTWASRVLGPAAWIIPLSVCLSIAGSLNGTMIAGGRIPFAAARRGQLPKIFEMADIHYHTPTPSLVFSTFFGLVYLLPNDFDSLVNAFTFSKWIFLGLSIASILVMRITRPTMHRPFKVPISVPVLSVITCCYLVVAPLVYKPDVLILYSLAFLLSTPVAYYFFVHRSCECRAFDKMTLTFQKIFQVAPTTWEDSN